MQHRLASLGYPLGLASTGALALAVRLLRVQEALQDPVFTRLTLEPAWTWAWAARLGIRWTAGDPAGSLQAYAHPPGAPWLLAALRSVGGSSLALAMGTQALLGSLVPVLVGLLATRLAGPERPWARAAGLLAATLAALGPVRIFYDATLLQVAPPTLALLAAALLLLREGGVFSHLAAGVALGVGSWWQPSLVLAGASALILARRRWALAGGLALALAPVLLRNAVVAGEWYPGPVRLGISLYEAWGPEAQEAGVPDRGVSREVAERLGWYRAGAREALGHPPDAGEVSAYWRKQAWSRLFTVGSLGRGAGRAVAAVAPWEVPDHHDLYRHLHRSAVLRLLPIFSPLLPGLAMVGLWAAWSSGRRRALLLLSLLAPALPVMILLSVVDRHRLPWTGPVVALGAVGALQAMGWLRQRRPGPALLALGGTLALGLLLSWNPFAGRFLVPDALARGPLLQSRAEWCTSRMGAEEQANLARVLLDAGERDGAAEAYLQALKIAPDHLASLTNLGLLLAEAGKRDQGVLLLQRAALLDPHRFETLLNLCGLILSKPDVKGAEPWCQVALEVGPDRAEAHYQMALLHVARQERDLALTRVRRALELDPGLTRARNLLVLLERP